MLTIDKLTPASRKDALAEVLTSPRVRLSVADIAKPHIIADAFEQFQPYAMER